MTREELDQFLREAGEGHLSNALLRRYLVEGVVDDPRGGDPIGQFIDDATGYMITDCHDCGTYGFTGTYKSVEGGLYRVCENCEERYTFCPTCNYFILANPAPGLHEHINPLVTRTTRISYTDFNTVPVAGGRGLIHGHAADVVSRVGGVTGTTRENLALQKSYEADSNYVDKTRYFGIELEVERAKKPPADIEDQVIEALGKEFAFLKRDGSLSNGGEGGFEIVSRPATMEYHKRRDGESGPWDTFFDNLSKYFLPNAQTTGMHIHISRASMTPMQLGKMLRFVNNKDNLTFINSVAQRDLTKPSPNGRIYSKINHDRKVSEVLSKKQHLRNCPWYGNNKKIANRYLTVNGRIAADDWGNPIIRSIEEDPVFIRARCMCPEGSYNLERYEALNVHTKRPTAEIRIFRGCTDKHIFFSNLEFCDALTSFAGEFAPEEMVYTKFTDWLSHGRRKQYSNLCKFLVDRDWIDPPKPKPKLEMESQPLPTEPTIRLDSEASPALFNREPLNF